eukprot:TRINITY_DN456_c1_g1_i1.p1 TRINITY_DN456_c1_g1~~TRINITY_DN456_c1_g1_i1.p1  ORF type:complete len:303 (+),score=58.53 TRINITY_DN456_c1_g1_i1:121-1029(+)
MDFRDVCGQWRIALQSQPRSHREVISIADDEKVVRERRRSWGDEDEEGEGEEGRRHEEKVSTTGSGSGGGGGGEMAALVKEWKEKRASSMMKWGFCRFHLEGSCSRKKKCKDSHIIKVCPYCSLRLIPAQVRPHLHWCFHYNNDIALSREQLQDFEWIPCPEDLETLPSQSSSQAGNVPPGETSATERQEGHQSQQRWRSEKDTRDVQMQSQRDSFLGRDNMNEEVEDEVKQWKQWRIMNLVNFGYCALQLEGRCPRKNCTEIHTHKVCPYCSRELVPAQVRPHIHWCFHYNTDLPICRERA